MPYKLSTESHSRCFVLSRPFHKVASASIVGIFWEVEASKPPLKLGEILSIITQFVGIFIIIPVSSVLRELERWDADAYRRL